MIDGYDMVKFTKMAHNHPKPKLLICANGSNTQLKDGYEIVKITKKNSHSSTA